MSINKYILLRKYFYVIVNKLYFYCCTITLTHSLITVRPHIFCEDSLPKFDLGLLITFPKIYLKQHFVSQLMSLVLVNNHF